MSVMLCALVPAALLAAPLVHLHADDHDTAVVHTHFSDHHGHDGSGSDRLIEEEDHARAVFFTALTVLATKAVTFAALTTSPSVVSAPPTRPAEVRVCRTHGHDPPLIGIAALRAPPAHLS